MPFVLVRPKQPILRTSFGGKKTVPGRGPGRPKGTGKGLFKKKPAATVSRGATGGATGSVLIPPPPPTAPANPAIAKVIGVRGTPYPIWPPDRAWKKERKSPESVISLSSSEEDRRGSQEDLVLIPDEAPGNQWDQGPDNQPPPTGGAAGLACS